MLTLRASEKMPRNAQASAAAKPADAVAHRCANLE